MRLNFYETCLVLAMLKNPDKSVFIDSLNNVLKTPHLDRELGDSINSLIEKFKSLSDAQVYRVYKDKMDGKIHSFPRYIIK